MSDSDQDELGSINVCGKSKQQLLDALRAMTVEESGQVNMVGYIDADGIVRALTWADLHGEEAANK